MTTQPASKKPRLSEGKLAILAIAVVFAVMLGFIAALTYFSGEISSSYHAINLSMQTLWTALILLSMWFRRKGNMLLHGVTLIVVVCATLVTFSSVIVMTPPTEGSMELYFNEPMHIFAFVSHGVLSIPAIAFAVWMVLLWRPSSTTFEAKTKRLAKLTWVLWVLSYIAGILSFLALYTSIFG
ncbi:MAG: hypothetical protein NWE93_03535 [Candidatus Bathyarchaeota archaeon]|nr:hypothetical protein [Candidatus Bathyarchaeota archaeon]